MKEKCIWLYDKQTPGYIPPAYKSGCNGLYHNELSDQACCFEFCPFCGKEIEMREEKS